MWGLQVIVIVIVIVITISHLLAFRALITAIITPGWVPLSTSFIAVSAMATGAGVLTIIVTAAALAPATGIFISTATAGSGFSRTVAGAAARSGSVCHSVHCMLLCRFALVELDLHIHGMHGLSQFII
jgi:hypothetical protein